MKHCKQCGRLVGKDKHICPDKAWNKGLRGVQVAWNKGVPLSDETKSKLRISLKGRKVWNKGLKSRQTAWNKGLKGVLVAWNKGQRNLGMTGEKNHNWKGGVTKVNERIRKSIEYKLWRTAVFERDGYTCIWCGCNESGQLNADHIKPFSLYPELRFSIDNGRTLCVDCHKTTNTYLNNKLKI